MNDGVLVSYNSMNHSMNDDVFVAYDGKNDVEMVPSNRIIDLS